MKLSGLSEEQILDALLTDLPLGREVILGPGDDCAAVLTPDPGLLLLLKTDCLVEHIHYLPSHRPAAVGWKALSRALSDIGAMGGRPEHALVTFFSPPDRPLAYWQGIYRGIIKAAREFSVSIVGGETSQSATAAISITVTGKVASRHLVRRSGGKAGDRLFVTGRLGGSLAGRHLRFQPRVKEGRWLAEKGFATAMMDLSDGLGADLPRLAAASRCGFEISLPDLPRTRGSSLEQAISDGEDYELLFAVDASKSSRLVARWKSVFPQVPLTEIGRLISPQEPSTPLPGGYDHFLRCQKAGKKISKNP